ncbi:MAG: DNA-directed RNA polymerase subunit beta' [Candidatus Paceibacterota bacterium]
MSQSHKFINDFDSVSLRMASPEAILSWSWGEITKPETINYRTQRSEKNGLFDEKIFGPDRDYECYCGKYRGVRYKGIICEKCGVEITRSIVRRERMGHIELATPVSHIWFLRSMPSRISLITGLTTSDLEKVIYFAGYLVTKVEEEERLRLLKQLDTEYKSKVKGADDKDAKEDIKERFVKAKQELELIKENTVLDEVAYHNYSVKYGTLFEAEIGAEAIYNMLKGMDLDELEKALETRLEKAGSIEKGKINRRLSAVRAMRSSGIRPEWMFLTRIPVIPPALRPMVPLDGGRYATSDVNDLYRRVINRNNRLKRLKDIMAPDVILRNEKRILQEAADSLIDNSIRHGNTMPSAVNQAQNRPLKSLADSLKGKRGLFRQNLLGKRVDYSGRSVIVVGPHLEIDECGLPKHMALELFKPFVISKLLSRELAYNIRSASKLIEDGADEVWAILEEVIANKHVLLNRAPTLHRLGIQAFRPTLIEGNAIQIHPLICTAFNADFDGDQMAVHVPLSTEAQAEARHFMAANKNILKPGSGDPVVSAKMLDIVLGTYWMTKIVEGDKGEGKYFPSPSHAVTAYDFGQVGFRAKIHVLPNEAEKFADFEHKPFETTVGRLKFNNVLPDDFPYINEDVERKTMGRLIDALIERYGLDGLPPILDEIKTFGFSYATHSGITWGLDDIKIPEEKHAVIARAKVEEGEIHEQYEDGLLSEDERKRKSLEIWHAAKSEVEELLPATLSKTGPVYDMIYSGARGSFSQITQMAGMKGLIQSTSGSTIEFPILASMKEGLSPIEYFITTHGSRKGLSDTALKTAQAGYLTRRLFDVAQDIIVSEDDCNTKNGLWIQKKTASGIEIPIAENVRGRYLAKDVTDAEGTVLFKRNHYLSKQDSELIEEKGIESVYVRSPMSCKTRYGVCRTCYGADLGTNKPIDIGEAVGTIAAQAIGEPGTQLTMRTFHSGGAASVGGDITSGLPRVEEVFEKRKPKHSAVVSRVSGVVSSVDTKDDNDKSITIIQDLEEKGSGKAKKEVTYSVYFNRTITVSEGQEVKKGDILTDGSVDIDELFKYAGTERAQEYIIHEIVKPYELQGESVSHKHIETIARQMFSRRRITKTGDTTLTQGDVVELSQFEEENARVAEEGGEEAKGEDVIMGITEVSLSRRSFLSSASFQHTTRVLIDAAVRGSKDPLIGLKENVIIGNLIPAGTGFVGSPKYEVIEEVKRNMKDEIQSGGAVEASK